jgi:hypothetical protein
VRAARARARAAAAAARVRGARGRRDDRVLLTMKFNVFVCARTRVCQERGHTLCHVCQERGHSTLAATQRQPRRYAHTRMHACMRGRHNSNAADTPPSPARRPAITRRAAATCHHQSRVNRGLHQIRAPPTTRAPTPRQRAPRSRPPSRPGGPRGPRSRPRWHHPAAARLLLRRPRESPRPMPAAPPPLLLLLLRGARARLLPRPPPPPLPRAAARASLRAYACAVARVKVRRESESHMSMRGHATITVEGSKPTPRTALSKMPNARQVKTREIGHGTTTHATRAQ